MTSSPPHIWFRSRRVHPRSVYYFWTGHHFDHLEEVGMSVPTFAWSEWCSPNGYPWLSGLLFGYYIYQLQQAAVKNMNSKYAIYSAWGHRLSSWVSRIVYRGSGKLVSQEILAYNFYRKSSTCRLMRMLRLVSSSMMISDVECSW